MGASGDVETDFAGTGSLAFVPTASEINTIEAVVRNILSSWFSKAGVGSGFSLINSSFDADGTKFDHVLDNTGVAIEETTGAVMITTKDPDTQIQGTVVSTTLSTDLTTTDAINPTDPTGLSTIAADASKIVLVWNASTDNIGVAGYNIYRGASSSDISTNLGTSPYPVYSDTGLPSGTYYYQVEAVDGAGNVSGRSNTANATTLSAADATAPTAPTGLTPTAASASRIDLSWNASPETDVIGYAVYRGGVWVASIKGITYSDTGLSSGTEYCYTVKAFDGVPNFSNASLPACATTSTGNPSAPANVSASAGDGQVTISWNSVGGATSYNLYMATQSGVTKDNYSTLTGGMKHSTTNTSYNHTGLTNGTTYYFVVTAVNTSGESVESAQVSATVFQTTGVGSKFAIATTTDTTSTDGTNKHPGREVAFSSAFDGTNYLVGIQGDATAHYNVGAQLISSTGSLVGSRISTGRTGGAPYIAFNGTNYLMAWPDDATYPNDVIYGMVIDKSGNTVKAPFAISTTVGNLDAGSIFCAGTTCTVGWYDRTTQAVYGRDIGSTGQFLTNEYVIEGGTAAGFPGGAPFFAVDANGNGIGVYDTGMEIRASIKGPTINKNTFVIATKAPSVAGCTDWNPSPVVFDGTNYLVVWNDHSDCAAHPAWDILAQRVDTSGNLVGSPFQVNSVNTSRAALPFLAFDGTNYLVTWTDGRNDANKDGICNTGEGTCYDVYGQYVSISGALVGSEFVINNDAGNQLGFINGFNNGKYLVLVDTGLVLSGTTSSEWLSGDVYGVFVTP